MTNAEPQHEQTPPLQDEIELNVDAADAPPQDDELAAARARVTALEKELADMKDKALRAMAEAENTRRRAERERQDTAKFAVSSFARELLSVTDNLQRALDAIKPEQRDANAELNTIFTGVDATQRELLRALAANGVKKIEAMGLAFDPNLHEVLFEVEMPGSAAGTVVQVIEHGYMIHDRLLRPARVGVAKGAADAVHAVDKEI